MASALAPASRILPCLSFCPDLMMSSDISTIADQFISSILIFPFQQGNWNLYPQILRVFLFYTVFTGDFCELKEKRQVSCSTGSHAEEWYTLVFIGESGVVCTRVWVQKPWESIREAWLHTSSIYCAYNAQYSSKKFRPEIIETWNRRGGNGYN